MNEDLQSAIARAIFDECYADSPAQDVPGEIRPGFTAFARSVIERLGLKVREHRCTPLCPANCRDLGRSEIVGLLPDGRKTWSDEPEEGVDAEESGLIALFGYGYSITRGKSQVQGEKLGRQLVRDMRHQSWSDGARAALLSEGYLSADFAEVLDDNPH